MKEKLLSVSIAAYNSEAYLKTTLCSLANSIDIDLLDVIVVDDGSTDRTSEIAKEFVEKYPDSFTLINKENGGYGSTINSSLKIAKGKYFKLLDSDDWYVTDNIATFLNYLKDADSDIIITPYRSFIGDENHPLKEHPLSYEPYVRFDIDRLTSLSMYELTVKTELVRDKICITEHCYYTDVEWFLKSVLCCKDFVAVPVYIYCYRLGREGQSVSIEGYRKHLKEHTYISKMAAEIINENSCLQGLQKPVSEILLQSYYLLLTSRRTKENIEELFGFRKFINEHATYSIQYMKRRIRILHSYPCLMFLSYRVIDFFCRILRRIKG